MRQLAGTLVLFALISCAATSEVVDLDDEPSVTTIGEVTVEGVPIETKSFCPEDKTCADDTEALKDTKITLAAPFVEVKALSVKDATGGETMLLVRTTDGAWNPVKTSFVSYFEEDPGCPSIERESAFSEIRSEAGVLVVVTKSDRGTFDDDGSGELDLVSARVCQIGDDDALECGEKEVVSAELSTYEGDERRVKKSFMTRYWVDADGELEVDHPFDGFEKVDSTST